MCASCRGATRHGATGQKGPQPTSRLATSSGPPTEPSTAAAVHRHGGGQWADMIADPAVNTITRPYRDLSVQEVDVPLAQEAIASLLRKRDVYHRTDFLVLRRGAETALVAVQPADPSALFSPAADMRVLSEPSATARIDEP